MQTPFTMAIVVSFSQSPLSPISFYLFLLVNLIFLRLKKGKDRLICCVYGRFLRTSIVMAKPMAIATIIAATPAMMYISVGGKAVTG